MKEKRYEFRYVNEWTGLFLLAVLALVIAAFFFSGHSQRWFSRKYIFNVLLPEEGASGLRRGDAVFILGVSAGYVDDIRVGHDGRMTVRAKIRGDFERFVCVDSTAVIKKTFGLAGDSYLEVTRGSGKPLAPSGPPVICYATGDSLDRVEKMLVDLHGVLKPVIEKAGTTFDTWTEVGSGLEKSQEQLNGLIVRLDEMVAAVAQGKGSVGKLLTDTALVDDAEKVLERANLLLTDLQAASTQLNAAVKNIENGTARLPEIGDAVAAGAKDLPALVQQTQTSMRELERLIEGLQRHWLVRKYVNKTNPPPAGSVPGAPAAPSRKPVKTLRSPRDATRE